MALGLRLRKGMMWAAWTVLCVASAMLVGLKFGRPLYYSDGQQQVGAVDVATSGMLRWLSPEPELEVPGDVTGRVSRLADGRLIYGVITNDGTSDLVTWHPDRPGVPPEPAYGLNTDANELAPAVGPDGRVYFASDRDGGEGGYDLFVATMTARGFGLSEPLVACNTALDETDPALDPFGDAVVFVRIDRQIDDGDDGVLWHWRSGGGLEPVEVFPELNRRKQLTIDRDPAYSADGAALWFVRKQRGASLTVCRSSRLGDAFDAPAVLSEPWRVEDLRSPLPLPGGRAIAFLQPPRSGEPALWFVGHAEELLPWWPGQHWLEWLLISFALCSLLLLLLLYFGQRWGTLDLVAQCLLLSLLLHFFVFLWLMGVEIAGSLVPSTDDDDSGMQVSVVASIVGADATGTGGESQVAASVEREVREQELAVVVPRSATSRVAPADAATLAIDNGTYDAAPRQAETQVQQAIADEAAVQAQRAATDPAAIVAPIQLAAVAKAGVDVEAAAARTTSQVATDRMRTLAVEVPTVGVARSAARTLEVSPTDPIEELPRRAGPALEVAPARPALADAVRPAESGEATPKAVVDAAPVVITARPARGSGPIASPRVAPARGAATPRGRPQVRQPDSEMGRSTPPTLAAVAGRRVAVAASPRTVSLPSMRMRGRANNLSPPLPSAGSGVASPVSDISARKVVTPSKSDEVDVRANRTVGLAPRRAPDEPLQRPSSALRRASPEILIRSGSGDHVPNGSGRLVGRVALRAPDADADAAADGRPARSSRVVPADIAAMPRELPTGPRETVSDPPRRGVSRVRGLAGALAEQLRVEPPRTLLSRAGPRDRVLPAATEPVAADTAYSNRFGPAKAKALERFGGTDATERAVQNGLQYLAKIQNRDGSWGDQEDFDDKYGSVYVGKTALCVLAFLGAGHTPTSESEHSAVVADAINHLLATQDERTGAFGQSSCYGHGISSYAIAECYGLTKEQEFGAKLRQPLVAGLNWILSNQGPRRDLVNRGGWGYFSPGLRAEDSYARVSVSSWMIMALESARLSGIDFSGEALPAARQYLELSFDRPNGWFRYNHQRNRLRSDWPTLPSSTPAAAFCLMLLGKESDAEMIEVACDYTVDRRPQRYRRYRDDDFVLRGQGNVYFWYYGSLCCFLKGGDAWDQWNARLRTLLPAAQSEDGSFPPIGVYAEEAGDSRGDHSFTTAMCVLSLEVYYRYFTPLLLGR